MASIKVACVVLMCMAVVAAPIAQAITCGQVVGNLAPCITYLRSGGAVPPSCCGGVKSLVSSAQTTADKRTVCGCLKSAVGAIPNYNDANAAALPGKCGVSVPYKISVSTNCATIKF
ncbi:PREDICTED: non-specific lipid-transfer protein 1-like [Lupinus angustifolius]|uniref:non-specific lipid-transfer protein 1-like n=1 Tax=Lupinus angustifolius TaxID=3871 RepID=UPI00092FC997|nr:PREDICTED: non-specific lipid-transfer protein 1-like [Lupinus angustifolius]XP_019462516.1 PREDICTED: non-specific lipid-transfer protein 1-like [Lupinus angustifolius]